MTCLLSMTNLSVDELAEQSPHVLWNLQDQLKSDTRQLALCREHFDKAVSKKYSMRIAAERHSLSDTTGMVCIKDEDISVCAAMAKTIEWDQKKLAHIAKKLILAGEDPTEFITITYHVSESVYDDWPDVLRDQFSSARSTQLGEQLFIFTGDREISA